MLDLFLGCHSNVKIQRQQKKLDYILSQETQIIYLFQVVDEHEVSIHAVEMVFADV